MKTRKAYCSACDRQVEIGVTDAPSHDGHATIPDVDIVCLDFGERCTGALCPMFGLPKIVMGVRLARSGVRPGQLQSVRALCEGCDQAVDLEVVDDSHGFCPICHATSRIVVLDLEDDSAVAVAVRDESAARGGGTGRGAVRGGALT